MADILIYDRDIKRLKKEFKLSKKYIKKNKLIPNTILDRIFVVIYDIEKSKIKITLSYKILYQFSKVSFDEFIKISDGKFRKITYEEINYSKDIKLFEEYKKYLKNNPVVLDFEKSIDLLLMLFNVDKNVFMFSKKINKYLEICSLSDIEGVDEELLEYEKKYFFKNYMYDKSMLN